MACDRHGSSPCVCASGKIPACTCSSPTPRRGAFAVPTRAIFRRRGRYESSLDINYRADVVYLQDLSIFPARELREIAAEGRLVVGQIASPLPDDEVLRAFDLLLSSFPHFVERFRAMGIDSEYFRIGFDTRVHERLQAAAGIDADAAAPGREGAVFVGGLNPDVHGGGVALLQRVVAEVPIEVYGYGGG